MIIDVHSHIIPGIDDGSKNMKMTLEMIKNAQKSDVKEIVATPHYLLEYGEATIQEVRNYVDEINVVLESQSIDVKIYSGQEVYYTERIVDDYIKGNIGTINNSRYMLIEFPMDKFDNDIIDTLYELQVRDIVPVIAHPERYKPIIENSTVINSFIEQGYLFQLNAGSIEGKFGEKVMKTSKLLLENNIYSFVGSDAHNNTNRNIKFEDAVILLNQYENFHVFRENSKKMLNNENLEFAGEKIKQKKTIFSFFRR